MRAQTYGSRLALIITALVPGAGATPVSAQCSVAANSGENVYVKDPFAGCRRVAIVNGNPVSKPRIRRDATTHILVFRHFVDGAVPIATRGTITNERNGSSNGIGFKEFDLTLGAGAALGDMTISLNSIPNDFTLKLAVDRRGEITGVTQAPAPARWGEEVRMTLSGRDIGEASVQVRDHSVSSIVSTGTSLQFTTKATITTARTQADVVAWDKANDPSLGKYFMVGSLTAGEVTYSTAAATASCTSVPGIGAPILSLPASGAVMSFASATEPIKANVTMSWQQVGDPQQKYILHTENVLITTSTSTTTVSKTGGSVTLAPLGVTDETVGPFSTSSSAASVTRQLTRNRIYKWKVRAVNCGQAAPWSAVGTFTVK